MLHISIVDDEHNLRKCSQETTSGHNEKQMAFPMGMKLLILLWFFTQQLPSTIADRAICRELTDTAAPPGCECSVASCCNLWQQDNSDLVELPMGCKLMVLYLDFNTSNFCNSANPSMNVCDAFAQEQESPQQTDISFDFLGGAIDTYLGTTCAQIEMIDQCHVFTLALGSSYLGTSSGVKIPADTSCTRSAAIDNTVQQNFYSAACAKGVGSHFWAGTGEVPFCPTEIPSITLRHRDDEDKLRWACCDVSLDINGTLTDLAYVHVVVNDTECVEDTLASWGRRTNLWHCLGLLLAVAGLLSI